MIFCGPFFEGFSILGKEKSPSEVDFSGGGRFCPHLEDGGFVGVLRELPERDLGEVVGFVADEVVVGGGG